MADEVMSDDMAEVISNMSPMGGATWSKRAFLTGFEEGWSLVLNDTERPKITVWIIIISFSETWKCKRGHLNVEQDELYAYLYCKERKPSTITENGKIDQCARVFVLEASCAKFCRGICFFFFPNFYGKTPF